MSAERAIAIYDSLLASIGEHAGAIEPRPLVSHWPHVGTNYGGLLIVGQALRGWSGHWQTGEASTLEGRRRILATARADNRDHADPMDWVPAHPKVRNSPFWIFARHVVELLAPGSSPWYSRFAWANLYPVAPESPPDNPTGPLKEAQDPFVGLWLLEAGRMLDATRVIVIAGPEYWRAAGNTLDLAVLSRAEKPLMWTGSADARTFVVGYHPKWASLNHWGAPAYARIVASAFAGPSASNIHL